MSQDRYPISAERKIEALAYMQACVRKAGESIPLDAQLVNVEKIADARATRDDQSAVVYGLKFLDLSELDHLVGILENRL